jgi:hypothetical protein
MLMMRRISQAIVGMVLVVSVAGCAGQKGNAAAGGGMVGRGGSGWDGEYGDVQVGRGDRSDVATQPRGERVVSRSEAAAASSTLPSLADEESRRAKREVERVANLARMTELVPSLKAPDWITAGKVVKGDQTIVPASGTGGSLKDAYDAAVVSGQRELLKQAGIPAARVVIGRGAYQRMVDGQWQVFVEAVGVGGTGPLPILASPANTDKPPVDLIGE